jgi:hypothetical protein
MGMPTRCHCRVWSQRLLGSLAWRTLGIAQLLEAQGLRVGEETNLSRFYIVTAEKPAAASP